MRPALREASVHVHYIDFVYKLQAATGVRSNIRILADGPRRTHDTSKQDRAALQMRTTKPRILNNSSNVRPQPQHPVKVEREREYKVSAYIRSYA